MWNQINTGEYEGMLSETVSIQGREGKQVHAYLSRPLGAGHYPGIILIPHMPGWDEMNRETARRFSQHGYVALCPDIYGGFGTGTPGEVSAKAREGGGVPDEHVMQDCEGALAYLKALPYSGGMVGVIGMCSGGRHAFMAGCKVKGIDAAVDCWGGNVPIELTEQLSCPLLGIFGNDDKFPTPELVDQHEAELKKHGKDYEFHRYDGAGHAFWSYDREAYRPVQAMDSWEKTFAFFAKHLRGKK